METSGFYKMDEEVLQYAQNFVCGPGFDLDRSQKDSYSYPVEGWTWYDSVDEARVANGLPALVVGEEPVAE
jgi:hypothetical protein